MICRREWQAVAFGLAFSAALVGYVLFTTPGKLVAMGLHDATFEDYHVAEGYDGATPYFYARLNDGNRVRFAMNEGRARNGLIKGVPIVLRHFLDVDKQRDTYTFTAYQDPVLNEKYKIKTPTP